MKPKKRTCKSPDCGVKNSVDNMRIIGLDAVCNDVDCLASYGLWKARKEAEKRKKAKDKKYREETKAIRAKSEFHTSRDLIEYLRKQI